MFLSEFRRSTVLVVSIACGFHACVWADDAGFEAAVIAFKSGRHGHAFGQFVALANDGDADAARFSLFLLKYGPLLYGSHWDATTQEQWNWARLASTTTARQPPAFVALKPAKPLHSAVQAKHRHRSSTSTIAPKPRRGEPDATQ